MYRSSVVELSRGYFGRWGAFSVWTDRRHKNNVAVVESWSFVVVCSTVLLE